MKSPVFSGAMRKIYSGSAVNCFSPFVNFMDESLNFKHDVENSVGNVENKFKTSPLFQTRKKSVSTGNVEM